MNRKRDELVKGLAMDTSDGSGSLTLSRGNRSTLKNLQQTSEAPSMIDSDLLSGDDKSSSHITSNIDSVYSFYNQQKESAGQKSCS
jgi:hypothetical protein